MSAAYRYDEKNEAPFEKQLREMIEYRNIPYYEIWIGTDGYSVSNPSYKAYDSESADDTILREELGLTRDRLSRLVIGRSGTAYALSPEYYEERTGEAYPYDIAEKYGLTSIVVMVISLDNALSRIHSGKFDS